LEYLLISSQQHTLDLYKSLFQGFVVAFYLGDSIRSLSYFLQLAQRGGWHLIPLTDWITYNTASLQLSLLFCRYGFGNEAVLSNRCSDVIGLAIPLA
jgi:hypothetical protein